MECVELAAKLVISDSVPEEEVVNSSNVIRNDLKTRIKNQYSQEQTEELFLQNEEFCNTIDPQNYLHSDLTSCGTNKIDLEIPSQLYVTNNATLMSEEITISKGSSTILKEMEDNESVNSTETSNINAENTGSTDSSYVQYNWSMAPKLLCTAVKEYQPTELYENFTKGCQWAPDGTCLLVSSEDFRLRIYELPKELYSGNLSTYDPTQVNFIPTLTIKEGDLVYDVCWYPFMDSWLPTTCCFLSTSKESPVHLWDAINGELRATYRAYNQLDEVEAAISVQFVNLAQEVWCGFKNAVRTFDISRPGRQISTIQFKHDFPNINGLVSCIRENPVMPGLVAFGTYSKCIGLYKDGPLCTFKTGSGVTQVEFSSCGTKLFSAVRKNCEFLCWDLRNPGIVLHSFEGRQCDTNQRIQFAITPDNKQIISGGTDGNISMWELSESTNYDEDINPKYKIRLSKDCINGISLHKSLPIAATSSGQRWYGTENTDRDNSVRLWWTS